MTIFSTSGFMSASSLGFIFKLRDSADAANSSEVEVPPILHLLQTFLTLR